MKKGSFILSTAVMICSIFATPVMASTYTVAAGDTLSKIAKKHSTSVSRLVELNKLSSEKIYPNQVLKVPVANHSSANKANTNTLKNTATYTVAPGDTLVKIAKKHRMTLAELKAWNKLKNDRIYPGQKLIVANGSKKGTVVLPKSAPKTKTISNASNNSSTAIGANKVYVVKKGDTLWSISNAFGLTVQQLSTLNNLKSNSIKIGQTLKIAVSTSVENPKPPKSPVTVPIIDKQVQKIIVEEAKKLIGVPYVWAGSSPTGFDCSGFFYYVYKKAGYPISRVSAATYFDLGKPVSTPQPGDAVFFHPSPSNSYSITHMGIYLGNNQFIHASSSKGVTISSLDETYYKTRMAGFTRF